MANLNAPFGLLPMEGAMGTAPNYQLTQANIAYNMTTPIYRGDLVERLVTGYIRQWQAGSSVAIIAGVFMGVEYLSTAQGKMVSNSYWPGSDVASTAQNTIVAKILPLGAGAQPMIFRVQSDATGVAFADIGANVEFTPGTGNALNGQSGGYISGIAQTATLPLKIIGLYGGLPGAGGRMGIQAGSDGPYSGSATGAYAHAIVAANTVGTGTAGLTT
jgi:hypothetical protein